jgi:hypothetical protein
MFTDSLVVSCFEAAKCRQVDRRPRYVVQKSEMDIKTGPYAGWFLEDQYVIDD